jgi:hypothetical protein
MATTLKLIACLHLLYPFFACASSGFLHRPNGHVLTAAQKSTVLAAIENALGEKHRAATEVRLAPLEQMLAPTLNALPKNEYGKLGHRAARYALHRLFVQRHAWFVKGIELTGEMVEGTFQEKLPTEMLQDGVPDQVQTLFEEKLGSHGLDAHEVAVMAATLENLAHAESMERLQAAYRIARVSPSTVSSLALDEVDKLLDIYMAAFVSGMSIEEHEAKNGTHASIVQLASTIYPGFSDVQGFVRRLRNEATSDRSSISSVELTQVITRIGDQYGRWQAYECDDLKKKMLAIEDDGTGRLSLAKFYGAALNQNHWQFSESPDYLRAIGALDESNPENPRVIMTNYILSPSNCVASSNYYQVCCLDECEDLLDHLEREIKAPAATPAQIADLVAAMPSSTSTANRVLPDHLRSRLEDIAASNEGEVPLHGRLFAQWMHHVYPRECPYPHMSGSKRNTMRLDDWEQETGLVSTASAADMNRYVDAAVEGSSQKEITWTDDDEHYVERAAPRFAVLRAFSRFCVVVASVTATGVFLWRLSQTKQIETSLNWDALTKSHYV